MAGRGEEKKKKEKDGNKEAAWTFMRIYILIERQWRGGEEGLRSYILHLVQM